jgi:hypothetical protein
MLIDDTRQKAEILNKQYHSVFTPECENEELPSLTDNYPSMPGIFFVFVLFLNFRHSILYFRDSSSMLF